MPKLPTAASAITSHSIVTSTCCNATYNCHHFGHFAWLWKRTIICKHCSRKHSTCDCHCPNEEECDEPIPCQHITPRYAICTGAHTATSQYPTCKAALDHHACKLMGGRSFYTFYYSLYMSFPHSLMCDASAEHTELTINCTTTSSPPILDWLWGPTESYLFPLHSQNPVVKTHPPPIMQSNCYNFL